ncbi:hypothetical protein BDQ17DRAFT_1332912 [Cyathus striatus]|nr:hypothetical protein BDQ17DRAFT_1332912 [Cyathus striatus]
MLYVHINPELDSCQLVVFTFQQPTYWVIVRMIYLYMDAQLRFLSSNTRPCTQIGSEEKPSTIHPSGVRRNRAKSPAITISPPSRPLALTQWRNHPNPNSQNTTQGRIALHVQKERTAARGSGEKVQKALKEKTEEVNGGDRKLKEQKERSRERFRYDSDEDGFGSIDEDDSGIKYSDVDSIISAGEDDEEEEEEFTVRYGF